MNKKISPHFAIMIVLLIAVMLGFIFWPTNNHKEDELINSQTSVGRSEGDEKACTQEAKLCPDGSYVGRIGPNCEFVSCPDNYYDELAKKCDGNSCCLHSVNDMKTGNFRLVDNGTCPNGFRKNGFECLGSYAWCEPDDIIGNNKDEHGCIGSAGYSWCESKQKCLRSWEEKCDK